MPNPLRLTAVEQPEIILKHWAAYALLVPDLGEPSVHVVGLNVLSGRGRVSSPVVKVHVTGRRVITRSGRVYDLAGIPGEPQGCLAMLSGWATNWDAVVLADVTEMLLGLPGQDGRALATRTTVLH